MQDLISCCIYIFYGVFEVGEKFWMAMSQIIAKALGHAQKILVKIFLFFDLVAIHDPAHIKTNGLRIDKSIVRSKIRIAITKTFLSQFLRQG